MLVVALLLVYLTANGWCLYIEYTLLTPKTAQLDSYIISHFTLHSCSGTQQSSPCQVEIKLSLSDYKSPGDEYVELLASSQTGIKRFQTALENSTTVTVGETKDIYLKLTGDNLIPEIYNLTVRDSTGAILESLPIQLLSPDSLVLIQTDKPIYKPKDTLRIRALLLAENLTPLNSPFNATVYDASKNKLRRWTNVKPNNGMADLELNIASRPPLGKWNISVNTPISSNSIEVEVNEYVLPRYKVDIVSLNSILNTDTTFNTSIYCQYSYGEPVRGVLTVELFHAAEVIGKVFYNKLGTEVIEDFFGSADLSVLVDGEKFSQGGYLYLNVTMKELAGGEIRSASKKISVTKNKYSIEWMPFNSLYYRPGLAYTAFYKLSSTSGDTLPSSINVSVTTSDGIFFTKTAPVLPEGYVAVEIETGNINGTLSLQAYVGGPAKFAISTSDPDATYHVLITAKGKLLSSFSCNEPQNCIRLQLGPEHVPITSVLVYAKVGQELLADSVTFNVFGALQNEVSVDVSDKTVRPGEDVKFTIETQPGSLLALASVDSRVLQLRKSNWIDLNLIKTQLNRFNRRSGVCDALYEDFNPVPDVPSDFSLPIPGVKSAGHIIAVAGYVVRTSLKHVACENIKPFFNGITSAPNVRLRDFFPETWLWQLLPINESSTIVTKTAPDSITTWRSSALSIHPVHGLGIFDLPAITVFQELFVDVRFPYSAKVDEEMQIPVVANNYMETAMFCSLRFNGSENYNILQKSGYSNGSIVETFYMKPRSQVTNLYSMKPTRRGTAYVHMRIDCDNGVGDAVVKTFLVKSSGTPKVYCHNEYVTLSANSSYISVKNTTLPYNAVEGSADLSATITGNLLGNLLESLDDLITLPFGCGEQNMITMAPSIFIRKYLDTLDQVDQKVVKLTTVAMMKGYLNQLKFKHPDGSFSGFGIKDGVGSTWLTAFVVKCFRQARKYIEDTVDQEVMDGARRFLALNIREDGAYIEPGVVVHTEMQGGGLGHRYALTAFNAIALLEDDPDKQPLIDYLRKFHTLTYLEATYNRVSRDPYRLAIVTYALILAESPRAGDFFEKLTELARKENNLMYWSDNDVGVGPEYLTSLYESPNVGSSTVEMTSYALLCYLELGKLVEARPIALFLIGIRNRKGGFRSTQDTVLGLQALAKFGEKAGVSSEGLSASFKAGPEVYSKTINLENFLITHSHQFSNATDSVTVEANGMGTALLSVCVDYNVNFEDNRKTISVDVKTSLHPEVNITYVIACVRATDAATGMGVVSIVMPTGFSPILTQINSEPVQPKLAESAEDDSTVHAYFDSFFKDQETCITTPIEQVMYVGNIQPALVKAYDYYANDGGDMKLYTPLFHEYVQMIEEPNEQHKQHNGVSASVIIPRSQYVAMACLYLLYYYSSLIFI